MKIKKGIFFVLACVAGVTLLMNASENDESRNKARYYFTLGSIEAASENMPEAYEYFKKAYETDPTFSDASFTYGSQRLFIQTDTLQSERELLKSLDLLRQYVDSYPSDLYAAQMYGYVTSRLDTVAEAIRIYERVDSLMPRETQILLNLSEAYMMNRQPSDAIKALERYEKTEGKAQPVSLKKITYNLAAGDTVAAVKEANDLIAAHPYDPFSRVLKGNLYEVIGNNDSVVAAFKEAELIAPDNGAVKMALANYYRNIGDSVMLDNKIYEALLSEDFELEEKISILGDYLQTLIDGKGEKSRGDYLFTVLQAQYPHEPKLLDLSARYSGAKGDFQGAAEQIGYAIDLDATNENYWLQLISYQLASEQYEAAVESYKRATENIVPNEAMKRMYAIAASQLDDTEFAESVLEELLKDSNPSLTISGDEDLTAVRNSLDYDGLVWVSNLYDMAGDLNFKGGDKDKAFKAYERAIYFFPDNALALNNYAYFLSEEGMDLEKAKQMSRRALDLDENNPTYIDTYAWVLFKMKNYEEALDYQKLAIDMAEERGEEIAEYYSHYGDILFMNHDLDEAVKNWEKALELEPDNELLKKKVAHKTFFFK